MSELHIQTTKLDDIGKYTCTINNLLATVTSTKELVVKRSSGTRLGLSHIGKFAHNIHICRIIPELDIIMMILSLQELQLQWEYLF